MQFCSSNRRRKSNLRNRQANTKEIKMATQIISWACKNCGADYDLEEEANACCEPEEEDEEQELED